MIGDDLRLCFDLRRCKQCTLRLAFAACGQAGLAIASTTAAEAVDDGGGVS